MIKMQVSKILEKEILYNVILSYNIQKKYKIKANIECFLLTIEPISELIMILVKQYFKYNFKCARKLFIFNSIRENRCLISYLRPYVV